MFIKKQIFAVIVILLAVFFVTCEDMFFSQDKEIEYTDVVYSEDRTKVTLYLDGVGVPKTESQRAMSLRLAKMAYDYLEVLFISGSNVARAQWELGQSAGISGVARGVTYTNGSTPGPAALMAVGRKEGKTLLGIGELASADTAIATTTKSVTFELHSIQTGLLVASESKGVGNNPLDILNDNSLVFDTASIHTGAKRSPLGNSEYPMYILPNGTGDSATQKAKYTFAGAADTYSDVIKLTRTSGGLLDVEVRLPRYQDNGRYFVPPSSLDMRSTVEATGYTAFNNVVDLTFTRKGTGIFSFYIDIPVYIFSDNESTNGGKLKNVNWHITTGLGQELYSLDDGLGSGGCVLMGIGVGALDWLDIEWRWIN